SFGSREATDPPSVGQRITSCCRRSRATAPGRERGASRAAGSRGSPRARTRRRRRARAHRGELAEFVIDLLNLGGRGGGGSRTAIAAVEVLHPGPHAL